MATNMKENGFETMIVKYLVENNHYEEGGNSDYNKIYAIDEVRLFRFLHDTQDEKLAELRIEDNEIEKKKFLDRLSKKISDDGVINIIRKGMKYKNRDVEIPEMEEDTLVERTEEAVVELDISATGMKSNNNQNDIFVMSDIYNASDVNMARMNEDITDVTGESEYVETKENEPMDKVGWIVRRISELGGYENISDLVKADVFRFDITDVGGSIRLFSDVVKRLEIKLDGDGLYEEFQRIYDEAVNRDADKERAEDKMWNSGRGR